MLINEKDFGTAEQGSGSAMRNVEIKKRAVESCPNMEWAIMFPFHYGV